MAVRIFSCVILIVMLLKSTGFSQEPADLLQQAQEYLNRSEYSMVVELLTKALGQIESLLLEEMKTCFPDAPKGWRTDAVNGNIVSTGKGNGIVATRTYYREGGGSSIDIKVETNALRTGNIRAMIMSPSKLQRVDAAMTLATVASRRCLERYDAVDRYGELIFVPTSSVIITFKAFDSKNNDMLHQIAEAMDWSRIEIRFP
ncbi:hypothetical protein JW960_16745 [candidate division KSB1 bacterium]|nr:hypothetical protein [candidate division KSB1 bacterium]